MSSIVDLSPDTHFLESIRANKAQLHVLIGEAVDNSFDADARNVEITINDDEIRFVDDGAGVSRDKWTALVRLGEHMPTTSTALGRYGVGIKYQAITAGDEFRVVSRSDRDGEIRLLVDWTEMLRRKSWGIQEPRWNEKLNYPTGTTINISKLRRKPQQKELERSRSDIAHMFYPALKSGCSVIFNGEPIVPAVDPLTLDAIETTVDVSLEKRAWIRAGILADPKAKLQGVQVSYKHRVIKSRSAFGCFDFSTSGMFARVDLIGKWGLSTFKDDISDEDEEALEAHVYNVLAPILDRCKKSSMSATVDEMRNRLNALIPTKIAAVRPVKQQDLGRKGEKKKRIGVAPDAPQSPTGPARSQRSPRTQLMIDFDISADSDGYGRFEPGRISRIWLAQDNPHVAQLLKQRDREAAQRELFLIALSIYLNAPQQQLELPFDGPFGMRLWKLFEQQNVVFAKDAA